MGQRYCRLIIRASREGMGMQRQRNRHRGGPGAAGGEMQGRHQHDKDIFHRLLDRHQSIERRLEKLPQGIRSVTRSDDPTVVALLHDHVPAMHRRLQEGFGLRRWDPLYVTIFDHADAITMDIQLLPDGVEVVELSDDPEVVRLIQAHGDAVDAFVARGHEAASRISPIPDHSQQ